MLWSVVSENDIFYKNHLVASSSVRSSNPYSYVRFGYYLDNAEMYGGRNSVDYNGDISINRSGIDLYFSLV